MSHVSQGLRDVGAASQTYPAKINRLGCLVPRFRICEKRVPHFSLILGEVGLEISYPTKFTRVPTPVIEMRISSPRLSVNESGGTMPVPVSRKHP